MITDISLANDTFYVLPVAYQLVAQSREQLIANRQLQTANYNPQFLRST
jgi:hypothetical protein